MPKKNILYFFYVTGILLFFSCNGANPQIEEIRWCINLEFHPLLQGKQNFARERLSVFILARDEDGQKDLESIHLIHQEEDFTWSVNALDWQELNSKDSSTWIGSNNFASIYLEEIPRGRYLLELYDHAGTKDQRTFSIYTKSTRKLAQSIAVPAAAAAPLHFVFPKDTKKVQIAAYNKNNHLLFMNPITVKKSRHLIDLEQWKAENDEINQIFVYYKVSNHTAIQIRLGPYSIE